MTRHVFDSSMTAHVWAQGSQSSGRNGKESLYFRTSYLFSYGTHYLLGYLAKAQGAAFINATRYSVSTSRHWRYATGAARHLQVLHVPELTLLARGDFESFDDRFNPLAARFMESEGKTKAEIARARRDRIAAHCMQFCEAFSAWPCGAYAEPGSLTRRDSMAALLGFAGFKNPERKAAGIRAAHAKAKAAEAAKEKREAESRLMRMASQVWKRRHNKAAWWKAIKDQVQGGRAESTLRDMRKARGVLKAAGKDATRREVNRFIRDLELASMRARCIAARLRENNTLEDAIRTVRPWIVNLAEIKSRAAAFEIAPSHTWPSLPSPDSGFLMSAHNAAAIVGRLGFLVSDLERRGFKKAAVTLAWYHGELREIAEDLARLSQTVVRLQHKRREAEQAERLEAWKRGESSSAPYVKRPDGSAYIRARGVERNESGEIIAGELQTSMGAAVPLTHALRVFRFLKKCRETGTAWSRNGRTIRVGHFTVDRISPDGSLVAGCHSFAWSEIESLALALGVSDLSPDESAVTASH